MIDGLTRELEEAGFHGVRLLRRSQRATLSREQALERITERHSPAFDLIDELEVRAGAERAVQELPSEVEYAVEWLIAIAER